MIVVYSIGVDGWVVCPPTSRKPVIRGFGPVEISEKAWSRLSVDDVIPCRMFLTDTEHLTAVASYIDGET